MKLRARERGAVIFERSMIVASLHIHTLRIRTTTRTTTKPKERDLL